MTSPLPTPPSFRLEGKTALVAGASSGIGLAGAVALAEAGEGDKISETKVLETWFAGKKVYARGD